MATQATSKAITFGNILLATDFATRSSISLPFALSIAQKYGSKIFAVHVVAPPAVGKIPAIEIQAIAAQALREARESMKAMEAKLSNISHETLLKKGDIWSEISALANEKRVDLIVLSTHGREGVSKLLLGSVAERIFRQSTCPVLTVGPNVSAEPGSIADVHTILCPIDFTAASLAALPYAISLAQENQARLYLMNVAPNPMTEGEEISLAKRLRALVPAEAQLWCEPKVIVEFGEAGDKIMEQAEELGIDVIVLGIRPVSTLAGTRTHLGTATAYKIVSHAICPVLSVRG